MLDKLGMIRVSGFLNDGFLIALPFFRVACLYALLQCGPAAQELCAAENHCRDSEIHSEAKPLVQII